MSFSEYLSKGGLLSLDLSPTANLTKKELLPHLIYRRQLFSDLPIEQFFTGLFHKLLGFAFFKACQISPLSMAVQNLSDDDLSKLVHCILHFPVSVTGTKGFDQAQVTAGGIDCKDFSPYTLESFLTPGLYATGEVLNIHGPCGGYNLLFAFASGLACGNHLG